MEKIFPFPKPLNKENHENLPVRVKPGPRKYNAHVRGIVGSTGYVLESPNDIGAIDADFLEKIK